MLGGSWPILLLLEPSSELTKAAVPAHKLRRKQYHDPQGLLLRCRTESLASYQKSFPLENLSGIFDAIAEAKKEDNEARMLEKEATKKVIALQVLKAFCTGTRPPVKH